MRLTDLIGSTVVDSAGADLGKVHDVRLVRAAPYGEAGALQIAGVIAGPGGAAVRLGYASPDVTGPWLLTSLLGRLSRRAKYIPWDDLTYAPGRLTVRVPTSSLRHPRDIS